MPTWWVCTCSFCRNARQPLDEPARDMRLACELCGLSGFPQVCHRAPSDISSCHPMGVLRGFHPLASVCRGVWELGRKGTPGHTVQGASAGTVLLCMRYTSSTEQRLACMHMYADIQKRSMPDGGCLGTALATSPSTCMSLLSAGDMYYKHHTNRCASEQRFVAGTQCRRRSRNAPSAEAPRHLRVTACC